MKKLILILFGGFLLGACADDEIVKKEDKKIAKLDVKLSVKDNIKTWNILELVEFHRYTESEKGIEKVLSKYDSVMWKVGDAEGAFEIYKPNHKVISWSHNFYNPGEYDTFLVGYKDGIEFYSDTLTLNIINNKEYLSYNWNEIKKTEYSLGYVNVLSDYFHLSTRPVVNNGKPGVFAKDSQGEYSEKQKITLQNYITSLYGEPICDLESPKHLQNKYYNEFNYKPKGETPICFWISPNARIMLLKKEHGDFDTYQVYAEPFFN